MFLVILPFETKAVFFALANGFGCFWGYIAHPIFRGDLSTNRSPQRSQQLRPFQRCSSDGFGVRSSATGPTHRTAPWTFKVEEDGRFGWFGWLLLFVFGGGGGDGVCCALCSMFFFLSLSLSLSTNTTVITVIVSSIVILTIYEYTWAGQVDVLIIKNWVIPKQSKTSI